MAKDKIAVDWVQPNNKTKVIVGLHPTYILYCFLPVIVDFHRGTLLASILWSFT